MSLVDSDVLSSVEAPPAPPVETASAPAQYTRVVAWPTSEPRVRPFRTRAHEGQRAPRSDRLQGALRTAAKVAAISLLSYAMMFNFSVVRGSSMSPGIHDGDRILVDHLSYVFGEVKRGDIVVLQYPLDPNLDYIKRVIGLPGDAITIESGRVEVNGVLIDEPYIADPDPRTRIETRVEPDHFFVLGDNRAHSSDSREFGQVPRANLRGRVDLRVWPLERVGTLD
jgi:signal peptidase I